MSQQNVTSHLYTFHSVFSTFGIVGLSQDRSAIESWALTVHLRAAVICSFKYLCGVNSNSDEKELSSKTIEEIEKAVSLLVSTTKQFSPLMLIQRGSYIIFPLG